MRWYDGLHRRRWSLRVLDGCKDNVRDSPTSGGVVGTVDVGEWDNGVADLELAFESMVALMDSKKWNRKMDNTKR